VITETASGDSGATEHLRETQTARRVIYQGRLLTFYEDDVTLADGTRAQREVVAHPGAVAIVAIDDDEKVVLVRQWRHALGRALWELPAGTRDRDEAPARTAERELAEETGLRAKHIVPLATAPLTPGYSTEVMHFFLAVDLSEGPTDRDADERMDVERFDHDGIEALVRRGEVDVKTMAGLGLAGWRTNVDGG
jgi:8-oxo-dGTP pyrophosphatase MutT (NUDIX family)